MKKLLLMFLLCCCVGCVSDNNHKMAGSFIKLKQDNDSITYAYCGIGVITINNPKNTGVMILDHKGIGIGSGNYPTASGYIGFDWSSQISVDEKVNTMIELKKWWNYSEILINFTDSNN